MGETGYFVAAAATKPLLHTWSLAIEEQFYIVFPLWLYADEPLGAALAAAGDRGGAASLSLALCIAMTHPQNDAGLLLHADAGLGAAGRARCWRSRRGGRAARRASAQALAAAGLALIAVAVFGFDARTPFPGQRGGAAGGAGRCW